MATLGGMDKNAYVVNLEDVEWEQKGEGFRVKKLLTAGTSYDREEVADVPIVAPGRDNWMLSQI